MSGDLPDPTLPAAPSSAATDDTVGAGEATLANAIPAAASASRASLPGYEVSALIGSGGMGEVVLARDQRIGRDVAIKRMRGEAPPAQLVERFLREARIQARLQHPAIVPVHEVGEDAHGQPYFTMQRLTGVTLAEVLASATLPRPRLLRAFADVCLAIQYAHSRGVIHRDLKPANIVLGEFGEVYVLDWGVARVLGDVEDSGAGVIESLDGMTQAGSLLGTPGYMAPEQVEGATDIGRAADVYALGAILFELLAGEPLHPRGRAALASTLGELDGAPGHRRSERAIAPELDAICTAALARDPARRPTTRELAERVQRYLDGDRDLEQRRELARTHLASARELIASGGPERMVDAMQAAGRALAVDPESREAAEVFTRLMLAPPSEHPPALRAELAAGDVALQRRQAKAAAFSFAAILVFLVAASANGVRSWALLAGIAAYTTVLAAAAWRISRRAALPGEMLAITVGNACLAAVTSRIFGSLIIAPSVTCVVAVSLCSYPRNIAHVRAVLALVVVGWLTPVVLEWSGLLGTTWQVAQGVVISSSTLVEIHGASTIALLVGTNVATFVVIGLFANALAASRREAQHQVTIQAWNFKQLLPAPR